LTPTVSGIFDIIVITNDTIYDDIVPPAAGFGSISVSASDGLGNFTFTTSGDVRDSYTLYEYIGSTLGSAYYTKTACGVEQFMTPSAVLSTVVDELQTTITTEVDLAQDAYYTVVVSRDNGYAVAYALISVGTGGTSGGTLTGITSASATAAASVTGGATQSAVVSTAVGGLTQSTSVAGGSASTNSGSSGAVSSGSGSSTGSIGQSGPGTSASSQSAGGSSAQANGQSGSTSAGQSASGGTSSKGASGSGNHSSSSTLTPAHLLYLAMFLVVMCLVMSV